MITGISFKNYRAIEDGSLKLEPITILTGPNGSGKTLVLQAFRYFNGDLPSIAELQPVGRPELAVELGFDFKVGGLTASRTFRKQPDEIDSSRFIVGRSTEIPKSAAEETARIFHGIGHSALVPAMMRQAVLIADHHRLAEDGWNLSGFLDHIRDNDPDSFAALSAALQRCMPEFDAIGFDSAGKGEKILKLRCTGTRNYIAARHLSDGTIRLVGLLALLHQPSLPRLICIENPDQAIHPRAFREIHHILDRLAYPQNHNLSRPRVQLLITTHSPAFLHEFTDRPEQIVLCAKNAEHHIVFRALTKTDDATRIISESMWGDSPAAAAPEQAPAT